MGLPKLFKRNKSKKSKKDAKESVELAPVDPPKHEEKIVEDAKVERVAVPPVDKQDTIQEDDEKTTESSTGGDAEPAKEDAPAEEEEQQQQTSSKAIMEDEYEESQGAEDATKETESPWNRCGCDPAVLKNLQAAVGF